MSLTSIQFIIFLIGTVIIYFSVPKKYQWMILLAASYVFYLSAGVKLVGFLLTTTLSTYFAGLFLYKTLHESKEALDLKNEKDRSKKKELNKKLKWKMKKIVALVLIFNFGILAVLKYYNVFAINLNERFQSELPIVGFLIPLGISFYMFQSIGYVIDVYRKKYEPEKNVFKFALFLSFFPQIIQGPISRFDQLSPQLIKGYKFSYDHFKYGVQLMIWGYFKKLIIADRAAVVVGKVFGNYWTYPGSVVAFGVLFYCIQIYCDFSGGIDIIRGIARVMGIEMVENFRRPYFATSLADYWRRWHMTLGSWMKDYLFYPLSLSKSFFKFSKKCRKKLKGNLGKILPTSLVTFIVFFAIGIWHGASFKYIAFGIFNGVIITFSLLAAPIYAKVLEKLHIQPDHILWKIFQMIRTSILVFIGRYFTRGASFLAAGYMLKQTFFDFGTIQMLRETIPSFGLEKIDYGLIIMGCIILFIVGLFQEKGFQIRVVLEKESPWIQGIVLFVGLVVIVIFGLYREGYISSEFIYRQF